MIRECLEGHKIAPLVADTKVVATLLYAALCGRVPDGDAVYLDVPLPNAEAAALAESSGQSARRDDCEKGHHETRQQIHQVVPALRRYRSYHRQVQDKERWKAPSYAAMCPNEKDPEHGVVRGQHDNPL